jgi:hypothetical protein
VSGRPCSLRDGRKWQFRTVDRSSRYLVPSKRQNPCRYRRDPGKWCQFSHFLHSPQKAGTADLVDSLFHCTFDRTRIILALLFQRPLVLDASSTFGGILGSLAGRTTSADTHRRFGGSALGRLFRRAVGIEWASQRRKAGRNQQTGSESGQGKQFLAALIWYLLYFFR